MFDGYTDADVFSSYLIHLSSVVKREIWLVCDNASFHKTNYIIALAQSLNINLIFLPPYSPFLNPIENLWGVLKEVFRRFFAESSYLEESIINACNYLSHLFI